MIQKINKIKKVGILFLFLFTTFSLQAEGGILPNEGKMLTTILVLVALLIGIFAFLFILERRLSKLENQIKNES